MSHDDSFDDSNHTGQDSSTAQTAVMDKDLEDQLDIIADLQMRAGNQNIKDVLLTYDPKLSKQQLKSNYAGFRKQYITDTLEFLGVHKTWSSYVSQTCVLDLIERIQSLLPEKCKHCQQKYSTIVGDQALLPCKTCMRSRTNNV